MDFSNCKQSKVIIEAEAKEAGIKYVLTANYVGYTHSEAANELAAVINQAYNSDLYKTGENPLLVKLFISKEISMCLEAKPFFLP